MKQIKSKMSSSSSSNKFKEEGNKLFMKRNYKEATEMYTKAIEKSPSSTHYTNRALSYFKLQQWSQVIDDCRRAIELDPHSVKAYFFMGQSLCELCHFDEAIVNLKRAHELTKELKENYGKFFYTYYMNLQPFCFVIQLAFRRLRHKLSQLKLRL